VTGKVNDPQGQDTPHIRYQISLQSDFSNTVTDSGWIPNGQSWTVPSGTLLDGRSYYWRAQSWDGWPLKGHSYPASNTRQFTVALPHLGADSRWPMWKDSAGNGMVIQVNESNGNLLLSYPLDTLQTPVGPLSVALTWNSQDGVNSGYGRGWVLSAGAGSDPRDLPVELDTIDSGEARQIRFRGDQSYHSWLAPHGAFGLDHVWATTVLRSVHGTGRRTTRFRSTSLPMRLRSWSRRTRDHHVPSRAP
jgi:hypothetical protein